MLLREGGLIGRVDADRESVRGLTGARELVELGHELGHALPELRGLLLRETGMPDEAPQLPVEKRLRRLAGGDLEVVEVARQLVALRSLHRDVEHPRRPPVE